MAKIDVIMPQMGESIAEGTLSRWIKQVGDAVKRDEPIFEISTDKVDAEIPAPAAGVLAEILVKEGETVAVQTVVARIETDASAAASPGPSAPAPAAGAAPPKSAAAPAPAKAPPAPAPAPAAAAPSRPSAPTPAPAAARATTEANGAESAEERLRRRSTPLVRKMAAEHNLDLTAIPGSGLAGRVTKNDLLDYLEGGTGQRPAAEAPPVPAAAQRPGASAPAPAPAAAGVDPWEGDTVQPWSRIRKLTAEHMVLSRRVSPHVNTVFEIDYTRVSQVRAKKKKEYADRGVNLTYLAFIAKATADALQRSGVLERHPATSSY